MVPVGAVDAVDSRVLVRTAELLLAPRDGELSETALSELDSDEKGAREGEGAACWCSLDGEGGISVFVKL